MVHLPAKPATILVFDPDEVVVQVLVQVLARDGVKVVRTLDATEAPRLVEEHAPQLAVLDCCAGNGKGLELAQALSSRYAGLPLVLMDAAPMESESPTRAGRWHFLTKPLDLHELRRAVAVALEEAWASVPAGLPNPPSSAVIPMVFSPEGSRMRVYLAKLFRMACIVVIAGAVVAGFAMMTGIVRVPWQARVEAQAPPPAKAEASGVELVEGRPHTLAVPEDVRKALGIRKGNQELIVVVQRPTQTRPLVMPGSTALDPTRLFRIRARFAPSPSSAEVVEIGKVPELRQTGKMETVFREVRSGDRVRKGDLLAVFQSVDVGNKKNDLIDAIYQLKLDEEILKRAEAKAEAVPEVFLLNARRNVQGDINTINRAVSTLKTWGIPEEDIQAVRAEADKVVQRQGKHDKDKDALWARVEIKAPDDGVIIERNVSLHEIVVDNTTNLFQIAKVDKLTVFAHVPEDDLPTLEALTPDQRRWTVKTVGSDPIPGFIDDIGYIIDPNQHTAVVKGHINNKDEKLRGGQFIAAAVALPPPPDVVEVPIDAVVEDGQQCVVFVQTDPAKHYYTMRRVQLTHRFDRTAFVRAKPFANEEQPTADERQLGILTLEPLRVGERILKTGVGELKAALLDKEAQPAKKPS